MKKFILKESELTKIIQRVINEREQYMNEKDSDDRRDTPGGNPEYFYGDGSLDKLRNMAQDEDKDTWWESIKQKLAGVNAEQAAYNKEYNLPSTWRGSKEGYHEHITNKKFPHQLREQDVSTDHMTEWMFNSNKRIEKLVETNTEELLSGQKKIIKILGKLYDDSLNRQ